MMHDVKLYRVLVSYFEGGARGHEDTIGVMVEKHEGLNAVEKIIEARFGADYEILEATVLMEGDILTNEYA